MPLYKLMIDLRGQIFFGRSGDTCDAKLLSIFFCEYVDVDERKKSPLTHDGKRCQNT
jgi:hypothetical protein